jgi:hypothetical protein
MSGTYLKAMQIFFVMTHLQPHFLTFSEVLPTTIPIIRRHFQITQKDWNFQINSRRFSRSKVFLFLQNGS